MTATSHAATTSGAGARLSGGEKRSIAGMAGFGLLLLRPRVGRAHAAGGAGPVQPG